MEQGSALASGLSPNPTQGVFYRQFGRTWAAAAGARIRPRHPGHRCFAGRYASLPAFWSSLPPAPPRHPRHGLRSLAAGARNQSTPYKKCVPDLPPGKHLCQDARRPGGPMGWIAKRSTRRPGCGGWVWLASRVPPHARSACTPNWSAVATLSCAYAHQTHSKSRQASRRALRSSLPSVRIPGQDRPVLAPRYRNADHQSGRSGVHRSQPRGASCINSSPPRKCPQNATTTSRVLGRSSFGALPLRLHTAPR